MKKNEQYQIKVVANNQEKYDAYKYYRGKFSRAKKAECYLECLWLLHAMLEDRTSAFLYYLGFTKTGARRESTGRERYKQQIRQILSMPEKKGYYRFGNLEGKLCRISQLLNWDGSVSGEKTEYINSVWEAVAPLSQNEVLKSKVSYLHDEWRDKRNQLTHGLYTRTPDAVQEELLGLVAEGDKAIRMLDNAVRRIRNKKIRERWKFQ